MKKRKWSQTWIRSKIEYINRHDLLLNLSHNKQFVQSHSFLYDVTMIYIWGTFPFPMWIELCHIKTGLKIYVSVIPKEGLPGTTSSQAFFWYDTNYRIVFCGLHRLYFIYYNGVVHGSKEGLVKPLLYDNNKNIKTCFCMTWFIFERLYLVQVFFPSWLESFVVDLDDFFCLLLCDWLSLW